MVFLFEMFHDGWGDVRAGLGRRGYLMRVRLRESGVWMMLKWDRMGY